LRRERACTALFFSYRVLTPKKNDLEDRLAGYREIKLFQLMRRTMATQAQCLGSVKDIQAHLRHAKADTTANECKQELPESVKKMVSSVYRMLMKGAEQQASEDLPPKATNFSDEHAISN
jgi:hypothetical protein